MGFAQRMHQQKLARVMHGYVCMPSSLEAVGLPTGNKALAMFRIGAMFWVCLFALSAIQLTLYRVLTP